MIEVIRAMVLAAGLGRRMRRLTIEKPKALVKLSGITLLDRAIEKCKIAGVSSIVINSHYKGEMIQAHLAGRAGIITSLEEELLETGGGVCKALPHFGGDPFFVINCDSVWTDKSRTALQNLSSAWREEDMDALLLLQARENVVGYKGQGDFDQQASGQLSRPTNNNQASFVFMGVQLLHPRLFNGSANNRYSLNVFYDRALDIGRLYGVVHDGTWFHVGTPEELIVAERQISPVIDQCKSPR